MSEASAFDTHRFIKRLSACGFTEPQTETLVDGIYSPPPTDDESFFLTGSDPSFSLVPLTRSRPMTGGACSG